MATVLVIENDPSWHLGRMRDWLESAGLEINVLAAHAAEPIPDDAAGHDAVIALGGGRGADWMPALTSMLTKSAGRGTPTMAFCAASRAMAVSRGGATAPVEDFQPGPRIIGRRDAAVDDPLLGTAPMGLDVVWWRHEELTALPPDALLLAASAYGSPEVFRFGERFWGIQPHIELDSAMVTALGGQPEVAARVDAIGDFLTETWKPVMERFAALAQGRTSSSPLRILDQ